MYQSHEGQVDSTYAFVEYDYESDGRLVGMTYPSGKRLAYEYNFAGQVTAIRDGENMVQVPKNEGSSSGSDSGWNPQPTGNEIVRYVRDGAGRFMQTTYVEPDLTLDYTDGLDRFGRIIDHAWTNDNGDDIVRIQHGYDLSGNRMFRNDIVNPANSEVYSYDSMGQIKLLQRDNFSESWNFDATGNWVQYDKNGIVENRSHNKANEILTGIIHDANGNMTQIPSPKGDGNLNCVYDAWNRLIKINDNICYEYNGLNHRVKKTVNNVVTKSFFNEKWQELESNTNDDSTTYVWGLRYVDDIVYRDKNDERLYSLADPNWNVVATCNEDGFVEERLNYDAFGKVNGLNSEWNRTFTGQVLDNETGLMLYRNRFYHAELGRFTTRDPIGYYSRDTNLYRKVLNRITIKTDVLGLHFVIPGIFGNPSDYADQIYKNTLPPAVPTPNPDCPKGWKLVPNMNNPPKANGCGPKSQSDGFKKFLESLQQRASGGTGLIFDEACNSHDLCYGGCKDSKAKCDTDLLNDMIRVCINTFLKGKEVTIQHTGSIPNEYTDCVAIANTIYRGVMDGGKLTNLSHPILGNDAFNNARKGHCICVCDK